MSNDMKQLAEWILERRDYIYGRIDELEHRNTPGIDSLISTLITRIHIHDNTLAKMTEITGIDYLSEKE